MPRRRSEFERSGWVLFSDLIMGTGVGTFESGESGEGIPPSDAVTLCPGLRGKGDRGFPGVGGRGNENVSKIVSVRLERDGFRVGFSDSLVGEEGSLTTSCKTIFTVGVGSAFGVEAAGGERIACALALRARGSLSSTNTGSPYSS